MKVLRPAMAAVAVATAVAVIFVFFALQLASGQDRSLHEIRTEVKDRAVLAASLIDSIFDTVKSSQGQFSTNYSGAVDPAALDKYSKSNGAVFVFVTDAQGRRLAASSAAPPPGASSFSAAEIQGLVASHDLYHFNDLERWAGGYVAELAIPFQTTSGDTRVLVEAINPQLLVALFGSEFASLPGVRGEINYLVDGKGMVVISSDPKVTLGSRLPRFAATAAQATSGSSGGKYDQTAKLAYSNWQVVLVAPESALFASVDGAREYVPWIIFAALVVVAIVAILLGWRTLHSAAQVKDANRRLADVNAELSRANETLQRRAAELARSNEELDSFASIASHDLQEPLRKVRTFTEQLSVLEANNLSEKGRDYLVRANSAAERMQRLIEDLLKFSRVSTQGRPFEAVDLGEITRRVLTDLERQVEAAGATVEVGPLPVIMADALQMNQLMQNLLSNAIKFRKEGVTPVVRVSSVEDGQEVVLTVSDNGIGFEPRYESRIFRIFERLHGRNEYPGTGIGLALCRKIVDRHGGTIEASSEPGQGATFTVRLPMDQPDGTLGFGAVNNLQEVGSGAGV